MGSISVSKLAESHIAATLDDSENLDKFIRIRVNKGGCAGFEYDLVLDNSVADDDQVHREGNYRIVYDEFTAALIDGSQLDFNENLIGRGFMLRNPNAEITCGCGTSFSVKPRRSRMKHMRDRKEDRPRTE